MKPMGAQSLARKVILAIEGLMLACIAWALLASVSTLARSSSRETSFRELVPVFLVYLLSPALVALSNGLVVRFHWRSAQPVYLLFALLVVANAVLIHSWGMHSFPAQSVAYSIGAAAIACTIFIKIAALKRRGHDMANPSYMDAASAAQQSPEIAVLLAAIEAAFKDVQLGQGISIHEAREIDDHGSKKQRLKAREKDNETTWQAVPGKSLSKNEQYMCFLDPEGMRFYLPAFMSLYLKNEGAVAGTDPVHPVGEDLVLTLCSGDFILDEYQLRTVAAFLKYVAATDDYNLEDIELAFARYWNKHA